MIVFTFTGSAGNAQIGQTVAIKFKRVKHPALRRIVEEDIASTGEINIANTTWSITEHVSTQMRASIVPIARQQNWSSQAYDAAFAYVNALASRKMSDVETAQDHASKTMTVEQMAVVQANFALVCYGISLSRGNFVLQGMQQPWFPEKRSNAIAAHKAQSNQPNPEIFRDLDDQP